MDTRTLPPVEELADVGARTPRLWQQFREAACVGKRLDSDQGTESPSFPGQTCGARPSSNRFTVRFALWPGSDGTPRIAA
jgi:hypothetical protein